MSDSDKKSTAASVDWRGADLRGGQHGGHEPGIRRPQGLRPAGCEFHWQQPAIRGLAAPGCRGRDFQNATLYGARLQGAEAYQADFRNADLRQANLGGAYLEGAVLPVPRPTSRSSRAGRDRMQLMRRERAGWCPTTGPPARCETMARAKAVAAGGSGLDGEA